MDCGYMWFKKNERRLMIIYYFGLLSGCSKKLLWNVLFVVVGFKNTLFHCLSNISDSTKVEVSRDKRSFFNKQLNFIHNIILGISQNWVIIMID